MISLSQFNFHHHINEDKGISIVVFSSIDCGACRHIENALAQVQQAKKSWHIYKVDAQLDAALVNEFEVFHLPSLFLFHNGQYHCPLNCNALPSSIIEKVESCLRLPAEESP